MRPAAAGGSTDVMGRLLAAHLQSVWGQSAIVENRSGAGGTIGTAEIVTRHIVRGVQPVGTSAVSADLTADVTRDGRSRRSSNATRIRLRCRPAAISGSVTCSGLGRRLSVRHRCC